MKKNFCIRALSLFLVLLTLGASFILPALAIEGQPSMANVDAVCVVNAEHRKIVLQKEVHKKIYPTSTVKLMTALVVHDTFVGRLTEKITVTKEMLNATTGRHLGLKTGEAISVEDLLYALLIGGYNDAANILAFAVAGSVESFCDLMNKKAKEIGAADTHYTNPTGLHDEKMVTTAYDTALIGLEILENSELFAITKAIKHTVSVAGDSGEFTLYNRNYLITTSMTEDYYYSYAEGMNAGATDEGGDCVVTAGRLDGLTYVCVVMGGDASAPDENYAYKVAKNTLRYALVNFSVIKLKSQKAVITSLPVKFSATDDKVNIKMSKELSSLMYSGVEPDKEIEFVTELDYETLDAPFEEGHKVGKIKAYYNGNLLDEADLITEKAIDSHGFLIFMFHMKKLTQNPLFIIPLLLAIGAFVYYKIKTSGGRKKEKRRRRRYY